jgi:hypothetical protein
MSVRNAVLVGLTLVLVYLAALLPAGASLEPPLVAQLASGMPRDVAIQGDYAYVAAQGALVIFDISNPANPVQVAFCDTPGSAEGVAVSGDYAYVADWDHGLRVIDIADPEDPAEVGYRVTPGTAYGVAVSGSYAYVADHAAGLTVIDVSDPADPTVADTYDTSGFAWDVAVSGDYAYVADSFGGLLMLDIASPTGVTQVDSCAASNRVLDVAVSGSYAYAADGTAGLQIIEITDPAGLNCGVGTFDTPGTARGVFVSGDEVYVADGSGGLCVIDVATPASPALLGSYDTPGSAFAVAVADEAAYVADDFGGLRVVDVSGAPSATIIGQADTPGTSEGVAVASSTAYVADGDGGVRAFDISDPTEPDEVWACDAITPAMDAAVQGNYVYVADWSSGLRVIELTTPTAPTCAYGAVATPGNPSGVAVSGNRACVAVAGSGLSVVDISNPQVPSVLFTRATSGSANDAAVSGNYAFVAVGSAGLQIFDITSPTGPSSAIGTTGYSSGVDYDGGIVCLASGDAGLEVIDASDPLNPTKESTFAISGSAHDVAIHGDYAYVSAAGAGISVVDISDPANPTLAASCSTPSGPGPLDVAVLGGYGYTADAESGLVIVDILPPYTELGEADSPASGEAITVIGQDDGSAVAYIAAGAAGLRVIQASDATDANDPVLVGANSDLGDVTGAAVFGDTVYVSDADYGLRVVSGITPGNPYPLGTAALAGTPLGVGAYNYYALVAAGDQGIRVVNVYQTHDPEEVLAWNTPGWAGDVIVAEVGGADYACIADGGSGLRLVDLSVIGLPDIVLFADDFEDGYDLWVDSGTVEWHSASPKHGNYSVRMRTDGSLTRTISTDGQMDVNVSFYLGTTGFEDGTDYALAEWYDGSGWTELARINYGDRSDDGALHKFDLPLPTSADDNPDFALRFAVYGNDSNDSAYIDDIEITVANPGSATETGFYNTPGQASGVAAYGDYACVADGDEGLQIIDISRPASPAWQGQFPTTGYAEDVVAIAGIALVAAGNQGLVLVDFSTPTSPVELGSYDTPGYTTDVAIYEDHAYVLDYGWGLTVLGLWYSFRDIPFYQWAFSSVEDAVANGITQGFPDELYHPDWECRRDQMAAFIARAMAGGDENVPDYTGAGQVFQDVAWDHWAWKYVTYCWYHGVVQGYIGGDDLRYYGPDSIVKRDQMAVFIARAKGWVTVTDDMTQAGDLFLDVLAGFWAGTAIEACVNNGVVKGYPDDFYRPYYPVTRDQMAVFIDRAFLSP